ncbi:hypothetical protein EHS25_003404 [Saitozyma podzolica]|uniref:Xylanolytic transcriptional activator regulatory domain-containing protein n=1 Tax=Saitozyma podzolica TaxID=1890683 RepID=A0A427Y753_9TREE|nr:hypothetical protein EHS25_003404 [Saitozyma podzolica]
MQGSGFVDYTQFDFGTGPNSSAAGGGSSSATGTGTGAGPSSSGGMGWGNESIKRDGHVNGTGGGGACQKANVKCEWPSGRRKKRTRREMEEAKRLESKGGEQVLSDDEIDPVPQQQELQPQHRPQQQQHHQQQQSQQQQQQQQSQHQSQQQPQYTTNLSNTTYDPTDFWSLSNLSNLGQTNAGGTISTGIGTGSSATGGAGAGLNATGGGATMSNFVWPSGFTPEDQTFTFPMAEIGEPTMAQFMTSPATDMRLINALENQAAYIEGNPAEDQDLELFYYRISGSTAIHPGVNRISLKLQRRSADSPLAAAPHPEPDQSLPVTPTRAPQDIFDSTGMPHPHIWQPLFALFFKHMSQHFPSVSRQRMFERFESGTMSQFLAACICACGARFSPEARDNPTQACAPFIAKAQELIVPLIHLPTYDVVSGLLFLAWANYGQSSESGLWEFSGMAIRMGIDIGIHEISDIYESPAHVIRTKLLFWSIFVTDRVVAFATGRPASIPEDIIEIPLPEDADFFPDPARNTPNDPVEAVEPVPFVYLVKLMIICGRISNVLNGRRGKARTLVSTAEPLAEQLAELQMRLMQFIAGLPESLKWNIENFKHQEARAHGGAFLGLHLWAHAVLALIYHPELLKSPSGIETPLNQGISRNIKLSLASSRQICECMVFADLVSGESYISTPFIVQPLYVAAMALIHEMRAAQASESTGNPTDMFLVSMARQNFTALLNAVQKMEQYWAGANYVASLLEKRSGFNRSKTKANKKTFISLPDKGLLRRFTADPSHPNNVGPATETSLRESIAKSSGSGPSPYWLADLMAGYTVENMSFAPADTLDLERLLATGTQMMQGQGPPSGGAPGGTGQNVQNVQNVQGGQTMQGGMGMVRGLGGM